MSDPSTHRTQDTPPSHNFSHPYRQRAPTLSPQQNQEYNQDNPPMAPNNSRHFLPLPSTLFSRSTSNLNLRSEGHPHSDIDLSYVSPRRPGTAHTAFSSYSEPDLTLTALPQSQHQPPLPPLPQKFGGPAIEINLPNPKRLIKSPPRLPTKSTQGSGWRRLGRKVKSVFKFGRKKRNSMYSDDGGRVLQIGEPYGFQHVETHGIGPLRTGGPATVGGRTMAGGNSDEKEGVTIGAGLGRRMGARPGTGYGEAAGGLGRTDVEGTADEDDGDSTWEDYEETRIFFAQQDNMGRRP